MALTPFIRVTQADALVAETSSGGEARVTGFDALVALNYPSPFVRTTQAGALLTAKSSMDLRTSALDALVAARNGEELRVTETAVLVAVRGRTSNPKLRAWTFTLDGHDFYVLRLGVKLTLVYDVYSGEWMDWDAFGELYWPVNVGFNWVGGQGALDAAGNTFGSNVLVGDDTFPLLYFLDPNQPFDESPEILEPVQEVFFERVIQGQFAVTGRQVEPCFACWITTDMGDPAYTGAGVQLEISDDAGNSYDDMGTVTVTAGEMSPEIAWYSLGQIEAPGRLFRITDNGAVARIDGMEMNDPDDK